MWGFVLQGQQSIPIITYLNENCLISPCKGQIDSQTILSTCYLIRGQYISGSRSGGYCIKIVRWAAISIGERYVLQSKSFHNIIHHNRKIFLGYFVTECCGLFSI